MGFLDGGLIQDQRERPTKQVRLFLRSLLHFLSRLFTLLASHTSLAPPPPPPGMRRRVRVRDGPPNEEPHNPSAARRSLMGLHRETMYLLARTLAPRFLALSIVEKSRYKGSAIS